MQKNIYDIIFIKDAFDNLIFDNILTEKYMVKENG